MPSSASVEDKEIMLCIGAIIPSKTVCGFVVPVFQSSRTENAAVYFYCETTDHKHISAFKELHSGMKVVFANQNTEYSIGDLLPTAFYFCSSTGYKLLIDTDDELKKSLIEQINYSRRGANDMPLDAQCKVINHYLKDNKALFNLARDVFSQYLKELIQIDQNYADYWRQNIEKSYPGIFDQSGQGVNTPTVLQPTLLPMQTTALSVPTAHGDSTRTKRLSYAKENTVIAAKMRENILLKRLQALEDMPSPQNLLETEALARQYEELSAILSLPDMEERMKQLRMSLIHEQEISDVALSTLHEIAHIVAISNPIIGMKTKSTKRKFRLSYGKPR